MPTENTPRFARFVRSVEGRAVPRWGTRSRSQANELFGARRIPRTKEDRRAGAPVLEWDTERVIPLTEDYCRRFVREINNAVRRGDLVEVKRKDWEAYQKKVEKRREEARKKAEAEAKRKADEEAKATKAEACDAADDAPEVTVEDGDWVSDDLEDEAPGD